MKTLIILHGALGSCEQFSDLAALLHDSYDIHLLNFSGHGGNIMPGTFSIQRFSDDVLRFMDAKDIVSANFFGYSMGGYVALSLASMHGARVGKVVTLATKFDWTPEGAAKEIRMLDAEKIQQKIPAFADVLAARHQPADWKLLLRRTAEMMLELGHNPILTDAVLPTINAQVLLCRGDQDAMVTVEETQHVGKLIPGCQLATLDQTQHPIEKSNIRQLVQIIKNFI